MSRPPSSGGHHLVGVNLCWLVPGVVGGSEESTCRALVAVADRLAVGDLALEVRLFVLPTLAAAHPELAGRLPMEVAPVDGADKVRRVVTESSWLPRVARRTGIDLLHHAGGVVPPGASLLAPRVVPTLTIHDVQPLDHPEHFAASKRAYLRAMLGRSARAARRVAVPSEFTRGRVVDRLGVDPGKVEVVPWCLARPPAGRTGTAPASDDFAAARRAALGVGERYLLLPAITYPHKRHLLLLDAFDRVAEEDPDLELVLTGGAGPTEARVAARIADSPHRQRILRLGRVPAEDLDALYDDALAVVFPSEYEGFGLPTLEAMARGRPVVVSDQPALVEVVGDAALVVADSDATTAVAGWRDAVQAVVTDPDLRARLAAAGPPRAATFGPERTATALLGLWERALAADPPMGRP